MTEESLITLAKSIESAPNKNCVAPVSNNLVRRMRDTAARDLGEKIYLGSEPYSAIKKGAVSGATTTTKPLKTAT